MKRLFLTTAIVLLCHDLQAQNDCEKFKKKENDLQGVITYSTPVKLNGNQLVFYKTITNDGTQSSIVAVLSGITLNMGVFGIYLKLDDGTIIKNEAVRASPHVRGVYNYEYYAEYILSEDDLELLSKHKIVKFGIGDMQQDIKPKEAQHYQNYAICLPSLK